MKNSPAPSASRLAITGADSSDLFGQTLRTVAILVGACVLFVGALSAAAVTITSKAMGASPSSSEVQEMSSAAPKKALSI
jgi:hypothetical protein